MTILATQTIGSRSFHVGDVDPNTIETGQAGDLLLQTDGKLHKCLGGTQWVRDGSYIQKITVTHTQFQVASTTRDIEIFTLPAGARVESVTMKHKDRFLGGSIASYTISVGITGDLAKYASAFDVDQVTGDQVLQDSDNFVMEDWVATTSVRAAAISAGDDLDKSTSGDIEIFIKVSQIK